MNGHIGRVGTVAVYVVLTIIGLALGIALSRGSSISIAVVVAVAGIAILGLATLDLRAELWLLLLASYLLEYVAWVLGLPPQMIWLVYPLLVAAAFVSVTRSPRLPAVAVVTVAVVAAAAISAGLSFAGSGGGPLFGAAWAFWGDYAYVLLFLAVSVLRISGPQVRHLATLPIAMALLQAPAAAFQALVYRGQSPDLAGGLLGPHSSGSNAVFMAMAFALLMGLSLTQGKRRYVLAMPLLFVPMIAGSALGGILFVIVGTFTVVAVVALSRAFLARAGRNRVFVPVLAIVLGAVFVAFAVRSVMPLLDARAGKAAQLVFDPSRIFAYSEGITKSGGFGRLGGLRFVFSQAESLPALLLGHGPGATRTFLGSVESPILQANPGLGQGITFWIRSLLEYGLLGFLLQALLAAMAVAAGVRLYVAERTTWWAGVGLGLTGMAVVYFVGGIYMLAWSQEALAATFWLFFGLVARRLALGRSQLERAAVQETKTL